jgi:hypothetical protein
MGFWVTSGAGSKTDLEQTAMRIAGLIIGLILGVPGNAVTPPVALKDRMATVMYIRSGQDRLNILMFVPLGSTTPEITLGVCNVFATGITNLLQSNNVQGTVLCQNLVGLFGPGASNSAYASTIPFSTDQATAEKPAVAVLHATDVSGKHVDSDAFEIMKMSDILPVGMAMNLCLSMAHTEGHKKASNDAGTVHLKDLYYTCEPDNS